MAADGLTKAKGEAFQKEMIAHLGLKDLGSLINTANHQTASVGTSHGLSQTAPMLEPLYAAR